MAISFEEFKKRRTAGESANDIFKSSSAPAPKASSKIPTFEEFRQMRLAGQSADDIFGRNSNRDIDRTNWRGRTQVDSPAQDLRGANAFASFQNKVGSLPSGGRRENEEIPDAQGKTAPEFGSTISQLDAEEQLKRLRQKIEDAKGFASSGRAHGGHSGSFAPVYYNSRGEQVDIEQDPKWKTKAEYEASLGDKNEARKEYYTLLTMRDGIKQQADDMLEDYNRRLDAGESEEDLAEEYRKIQEKYAAADAYTPRLDAAYSAWQERRSELDETEKNYREAFSDYNKARRDYKLEQGKFQVANLLLGGIPAPIAAIKNVSDWLDYSKGNREEAPGWVFENYIGDSAKKAAEEYAAQGGDPSASVVGAGYGEIIAPISDALGYVGEAYGVEGSEKLREFADAMQYMENRWTNDQKTGRGEVGRFAVDAGVQAVPLAMDAALTYATGGGSAAAKAALAVRAFGGGTMEARHGGGNLAQQGLYGAGSAAVELLTEKMFDAFGGKVYGASQMDDVISHWAGSTFKTPAGRAAAKYVVEAAGEGIEEVTSDVINPILKSIYNDKSIVENYKDMFEDFDSVVYDFAIGAALGGLGGSTNVVAEMAGNISPQEEFFMNAGRQGMSFSEAAATWKAIEAYYGAEIDSAEPAGMEQLAAANENAAPEGTAESTSVDTDPEDHTAAQQRVVEEYQASTDTNLVQFAQDVIRTEGDEKNGLTFDLSPVSDRAASDIKAITGIDATGFKAAIQGSMVKHIYNDHGPNGITDQSMKDINDLGRMQYVLDNYDSAEPGKGSKAYRTNKADGKQGPSKTVVFGKAVNGTYYVVEAIPDTQAKTAYVVSAYMTKNRTDGEHAPDAKAPSRTAKTEGAHSSVLNDSISPSVSSVNAQSALASAVRGRKDADLMWRGYHEGQDVEAYSEAWSFAADVLGAHFNMTVEEARAQYPHKFREMTDAQLDLAMTVGRKAAEARVQQAKAKAAEQRQNRKTAAEAKQKAETAKEGTPGKGKNGSVSMKGGKFNGRTYRGVDVDSLSKKETRVVAMAQRLADAMGYHFVFFEGHPADGGTYIGDGTIFVNIKAGNLSKKTLAATVIGHEVVHSFQEKAPTAYEALQKHVLTHILQKSPAEFEALVQAQMKLEPGISYGKAVDELVANACQTMVRDSAEIRRLVRENMTLAERVRDSIEGIADKFKSAYADVDIHDNEEVYRAARAIEDAYDEILKDFDSAVREYKQNADAEKVTGKKISAGEGGVKNMAWDSYSEHEKENWKNSKKIVIYENDAQLLRFILDARDGKLGAKKMYFGKVTKALAARIKAETGVETEGFNLTLAAYEIEKIFKDHGVESKEALRGQRAITETDFADIPVVLSEADTITRSSKDWNGKPVIDFKKEMDGIRTVSAYVSDKKTLDLRVQTMFAGKKKSLATPIGVQAPINTPEANSGTALNQSISDSSEKSKGQNEEAVPDYGENPDASNMMFGTKETEQERKAREESVSNLKAENDILRARAAYWKGQTQQTRERTVRQQDTDRLANDLLRRFESRADKAEVKEALKELGDWLVQSDGDSLSYDELYDRARLIAEDIVDGNYALIDDSQKENLERLKDYLKSTPVKLTAEDWSNTGDENFRRRYGRYFTVSESGRTIDSLWGELAATFGEGVFPEDTYAPGDMLNMLGDYLDMWKPQYGNVFEANWNEAVDAAAGEIIDRMLGEGVRQTPATFADRAQQRLNAQIAKDKAKLDALREQKNARIEEIKRQASEKSAQIRMSEKAAKYEAVSKVKEHYQDMMQRQSEKRTETAGQRKYRAQVAEKVERLEKMLLTNSDKMHVPEVLKAPLADFLASIDFSSKSHLKNGTTTRADVKFQAALTALNDVLTKQERYLNGEENAEDRLGGYLDISQEAMDFLRETTEEIHRMMQTGEAYTVNAMSAEQLQGLSKLLSNITSAIRNMNNFMANERFATVKEAADADIRHMESLGSASEIERGSVVSALAWENGTPFYVLRRFGEGGKAVFDAFARGWEKMAFNVKEIIDFTEKVYTDKEVKTWKSEIHEITLSDGSQIRMTTAQIMALSQLIGREQAVKHITKGGIRIGNIKGKVGEIVDTNHYHLTPEDMSAILGKLTPRQAAVAKALQRFMAHKGALWGNEVSMRRFGYNFYDEGESYYPIRTDSNDRGMQDTEAMQNSMFRLLNLSASKSLNPKASNALIVEDIFDTFADHMADMAKLNGMGLPVLDAIKWFNYKDRVDLGDGEYDTRTIQGAMEQAFGDKAQKYFRTLMKDINGVTEAGDRGTGLLATLMSNYKAAAVGANLRVAFLQPTSYVRAAAIISPKYLAFAFTNRNAYKEALANSGTAVWKSLGYYDTNISRGMREQIEHNDSWKDKIVEGSMSLAELGDKLTWGRLWVACKMQAKATNQSLEGQALINATSDLFREVIYATQVMDSTLTRSELMRGKTLYSKAMTAFMAEPTLSYNLLMDAVSSYHLDVRANGKQGAWRRNSAKIGTAFSTYVASAAFAAVVESVADAFRDDDNDEFWEKFLEVLLGEGVTARIRGEKTTESILASLMSGNLAQDLTIIGKLPYVKSMYSTLQGYKSKDMSSAAFDAIIDSVKIWQETVWLANGKLDSPTKVTYYGNMTDWGKIYKSLQALSQLSGIGGSNLTRDVLAVWNSTVGEFRPDWKIKTYQSKAERTYLDKVYPHGVSWSAYQSALTAMDTDENGSVKQDEAGPYLRGEMEAGRLTEEEAEAIWSAATSGKKSLADWLEKNS